MYDLKGDKRERGKEEMEGGLLRTARTIFPILPPEVRYVTVSY